MEYFAAKRLSENLALARKWKGKTKFIAIAGGTNVILDVRAKALKPGTLVDISHLKNLSYIKEEKDQNWRSHHYLGTGII